MIITVANMKGGTGKSTLVANLACIMHEALDASVVILDLDAQETSRSWMEMGKLPIKAMTEGNPKTLEAEVAAVVLIDTPGNLHLEATQEAIRAADIVLVPCNPSPTDVSPTKRTIAAIQSLTKSPALLVPNKIQEGTILAREAEGWMKELGIPVARHPLHYLQVYQQTAVEGWVQSGPGYDDLKGLLKEIIAIAEKGHDK